ncbi:hypothetical protein ASPCADRAFT_179984 [Aspergillus carbonarius ITEM 5010]|uniref:Uncharacterized protein n=1 Tax=Aspergillus carbonarius (strain ITEM 5010) TaxID=602072 RepID=A0A1R3R668_ASPC5|nr:hypothetical protein ASPCADRAFT_179984 [Aspergillus carbonarius ITEM 5010]
MLVPAWPMPIVFHASSRCRGLSRAARPSPHWRDRHAVLASIIAVRVGIAARAGVHRTNRLMVGCGWPDVGPVPFALVTPADAFPGTVLFVAVHAEEAGRIRRRRDRGHVVAVGADAVRARATVPLRIRRPRCASGRSRVRMMASTARQPITRAAWSAFHGAVASAGATRRVAVPRSGSIGEEGSRQGGWVAWSPVRIGGIVQGVTRACGWRVDISLWDDAGRPARDSPPRR